MNTAVVTRREKYKLSPGAPSLSGKAKIYVGTEYVRSAKCEQHSKVSSDFVGVGDGLWIFVCKPMPHASKNTYHTFSARPPLHPIIEPTAPKTQEST